MRLRASVVQTSGGEGWSCHVQDAAGLNIAPLTSALALFDCVASSLTAADRADPTPGARDMPLEEEGHAEAPPPPGLETMTPPTTTHAMQVDHRAQREERATIRHRLEQDCKMPPTWNFRKKIDKYRCMPE